MRSEKGCDRPRLAGDPGSVARISRLVSPRAVPDTASSAHPMTPRAIARRLRWKTARQAFIARTSARSGRAGSRRDVAALAGRRVEIDRDQLAGLGVDKALVGSLPVRAGRR